MAYAVRADVINEFRGLKVSATDTVVTESKLDEWIAQAEAYVNSRLGEFYQVPITGTGALLILKNIVVYIVAARVKRVLRDVDSNQDPQQQPADTAKIAEKMIETYLPNKSKGELTPSAYLPDASLLEMSPISGSVISSGTTQAGRIFEKGVDKW